MTGRTPPPPPPSYPCTHIPSIFSSYNWNSTQFLIVAYLIRYYILFVKFAASFYKRSVILGDDYILKVLKFIFKSSRFDKICWHRSLPARHGSRGTYTNLYGHIGFVLRVQAGEKTIKRIGNANILPIFVSYVIKYTQSYDSEPW